MDRVRHGDYVLDKENEMRRIPMKSRDLAVAGMAVPFDKRMALRGDGNLKQQTNDVAKQLESVADRLRDMVNIKKQEEPIEGEFKEIST